MHHVGVTVAEAVVSGVETELGVSLDVEPAQVAGGVEIVPGYLANADAPAPAPARMDWLRTFLAAGVGAALFLTAGLAGVSGGTRQAYAHGGGAPAQYVGDTQSFTVASGTVAAPALRESYGTSYNFGGGFVSYTGQSVGDLAFKLALSAVGTPYVFGGASRSGFDCSGLIMLAYAAQGISLPHGVRSLSARSIRVPESEARLGDLVVMNGHNGFWAGPGMILDAPRPGGFVSVRAIWTDSYWIERVVG